MTPIEDTLTPAVALDLHRRVMLRGHFPTAEPIPELHVGCCEARIGNAQLACKYCDAQDDEGVAFAAYVFTYFAQDHCFSDGNKRLAWACLVYTLDRWGLTLDATDDEGVDLANRVVLHQIGPQDVATWIVARIKVDGNA